MATTNAVWGIDVGQCALKAIKLRPAEEGKAEAVAFDVIEHAKILSQPDADRDELITSALEKFASRNDWQGDRFVVGVPGQQTFARFCKMPPIDLKKDAKKIPELVRYEASQQIPFDMEDVVWDYQVFTSEDSPDVEVGIFAIRKDLIRKHLGFFSEAGIAPAGVQTIPAALYNFCQFDGQTAGEGGATVMIDVGAQNTDLIIVEPNAAWTRNIPLGGNSFTEALVRAFKLSFAKAESLKRSAATSKYARQIFQAMRPVFADLVAEIQRSIGFYSSTHRDIELRKVLALGNAFRLPGLQKYLENNLTISGGVTKLEKFGPASFYRAFEGGDDDGLEVRLRTSADGGVRLDLRNRTAHRLDLAVHDHYAPKSRSISMGPGARLARLFDLRQSARWYDLTINTAGLSYRLAGHVECGQGSLSDPAAAR